MIWLRGPWSSKITVPVPPAILQTRAGASLSGEEWDQAQEPWVESAAALPPSVGGPVVLLRRSAHPYLAEYDRRLRLERPDGSELTVDLPPNPG